MSSPNGRRPGLTSRMFATPAQLERPARRRAAGVLAVLALAALAVLGEVAYRALRSLAIALLVGSILALAIDGGGYLGARLP